MRNHKQPFWVCWGCYFLKERTGLEEQPRFCSHCLEPMEEIEIRESRKRPNLAAMAWNKWTRRIA